MLLLIHITQIYTHLQQSASVLRTKQQIQKLWHIYAEVIYICALDLFIHQQNDFKKLRINISNILERVCCQNKKHTT